MPASSRDYDESRLAVTSLPGRAGLRLIGEVDMTSHDHLRAALTALQADGLTTLHLDVSRLLFIDVAGTREIITLLQSRPGLRIILHSPPVSLRRIIAVLWPEANIKISGPVTGTTTAGSGPRTARNRHCSTRQARATGDPGAAQAPGSALTRPWPAS